MPEKEIKPGNIFIRSCPDSICNFAGPGGDTGAQTEWKHQVDNTFL
jgi:hypothetical protein